MNQNISHSLSSQCFVGFYQTNDLRIYLNKYCFSAHLFVQGEPRIS